MNIVPCSIVFILLLACIECSTYLLKYNDPSQCTEKQYFQISSLKCVACPPDTTKSADSLSCVCENGYRYTENNGGPDVKCTKCGVKQAATEDGWGCVKCPTDNRFDEATKLCKPCNKGVNVERALDGVLQLRATCLTCQGSTLGNQGGGVCRRCDQSYIEVSGDSCVCPVGVSLAKGTVIEEGGKCLSSKTTPFIENIPSVTELNYVFLRQHFRVAHALCKHYTNFTACQLLANLCVLHMYNDDNFANAQTFANDPCREYLEIRATYKGDFNGHFDWPSTLPWLYYRADTAPEVLRKADLPLALTRGERLKFAVATYTADGKFLGMSNDTSFLRLCDHPSSMDAGVFNFTVSYKSQCRVRISNTLWKDKQVLFYDLYLWVSADILYPIPVRVKNVRSLGRAVNEGTDHSKWKLTRRFFLMESLTGQTEAEKNPTYLRYASSLELQFRLLDDGLIYPPVLHVKYDDVQLTDSTNDVSVVRSFQITYEMNTDNILENVEISVGVLSVLASIYACVQIVSWRRREATQMLDCASLFVFTVYLCSALAFVFWIVSFVTCFQWLLFFKHQSTVIFLLPTSGQEQLLKGLVLAAVVMKAVDVVYILYRQINVDIFFIDWERPRSGLEQGTHPQVSIMRTLFVANEWREVQTCRLIKPTLQLVMTLFFLQVVGFQHLSTTHPETRYSFDSGEYAGEQSFVLRFGVISVVYIALAVAQWIVFAVFYERFVGDAIGDFIDFCSMSNISIFVMSHKNFGYYIHGRSVHGKADTSLHELYEQFQREESDMCGKRGLEANSEAQTFEMSLTPHFRHNYERILQPLLTRDSVRQNAASRQNPGYPGQTGLSPALEQSVLAYDSMNKYISLFIEHALKENDYVIREKVTMEKLLKNELQPAIDKSIFYKDDGQSFTDILLYGKEWNFLFFYLLLFVNVDWLSGWNPVLAAVVCYFVDVVMVTVRDVKGRKNLAQKTMVDERFLI